MQTPGHYNSVEMDTIRPRLPFMISEKSKSPRFKTIERSEPSPHSYNPNDRMIA